MADNYFDFLYGTNNKAEADKPVKDEKPTEKVDNNKETVVQDEAIGSPWTHRFTVYCKDPASNFLEELKAKDGVVAVYVKEKETSKPQETEEPKNS